MLQPIAAARADQPKETADPWSPGVRYNPVAGGMDLPAVIGLLGTGR